MKINLTDDEAPTVETVSCRAFVAGGDAKKVGIVESVLGHLGLKLGNMFKADLIVLVDVKLEMIRKYRHSVGGDCWILALTESVGARALMAAGASDVLSGKWTVNELCDRVDVALAGMKSDQPVGSFGDRRMN